jgi:hypothetical protein
MDSAKIIPIDSLKKHSTKHHFVHDSHANHVGHGLAALSVFWSLQVLLLILVQCFQNGSNFNYAFIVPLLVIDFFFIINIISRRDLITYEEIFVGYNVKDFSLTTELFRCANPKPGYMIPKWRAIKFWLFVCYFAIWWRYMMMYADVVGNITIGNHISPSNQSSCTRNASSTVVGAVFNPEGWFPQPGSLTSYQRTFDYVFCMLEATWAYPVTDQQTKVYGYEYLTGMPGIINCTSKGIGAGAIHVGITGPAGSSTCEGAYPDPAFGTTTPATQQTNVVLSTTYCPGNTPLPVADVPNALGKPRLLCPTCLSYYRYMTGITVGPAGYEHCQPYDNTAPINPLCFFCPSPGPSDFWLYGEFNRANDPSVGIVFAGLLTLHEKVIWAYWLQSVILIFLPFLEFWFYTFVKWNAQGVFLVRSMEAAADGKNTADDPIGGEWEKNWERKERERREAAKEAAEKAARNKIDTDNINPDSSAAVP